MSNCYCSTAEAAATIPAQRKEGRKEEEEEAKKILSTLLRSSDPGAGENLAGRVV